MTIIEFFRESIKELKFFLGFRISLSSANQITYNSLSVVESYLQTNSLIKPEQAILNILRYKPSFENMLDIGVGAGRTTSYFSETSKQYIGIDYSQNMITVCRQKFRNYPKMSFAVADARNLSIYENDSFDFILFSHGGLDSVEHEDRIKILKEIWRVARNGCYFSFSTSNLDAMKKFCTLKLSRNPKVFVKRIINLLLVRLLNSEMWMYSREKRNNLTHTMFNVGRGNNWSLKTYCITVGAQMEQLRDLGFKNITIFDMKGEQVKHVEKLIDFEVYFLSQVKKLQDVKHSP